MGFRICFFQRIDLFHLKYQMCVHRGLHIYLFIIPVLRGSALMLLSLFVMLVTCAPTLFFSVTRSLLALLMFLKNQSFKSHIDFLCFLFH